MAVVTTRSGLPTADQVFYGRLCVIAAGARRSIIRQEERTKESSLLEHDECTQSRPVGCLRRALWLRGPR